MAILTGPLDQISMACFTPFQSEWFWRRASDGTPPDCLVSSVGDCLCCEGIDELSGLHDGRATAHQPSGKHGGDRVAFALLAMDAAHLMDS